MFYIFNKIKQIGLNILYSIPFGMKGANDELLIQKSSSNSDNIGIHEVVNENKLSKDLLKGEVTQAVEELRYRTYEVSKESEKYEYIGNGICSKKNNNKGTNISFNQINKPICEDILHELKNVDTYGEERYFIKIKYNDIVRFKLEEYINSIDVSIIDDTASVKVHFNIIPNKYNIKSRAFINEIKKLKDIKTPYEIRRNEICSSIDNLSFTTSKANGEDDSIKYIFNSLTYVNTIMNEFECITEYKCISYERVNVTEKYVSPTMQKKYENKERKELTLNLSSNIIRKCICQSCGKEISVYDGDITNHDLGKILCQECLKNTLLLK